MPKVAVAGCGYWGRNLVRNMANLGALAALCDPDSRVTAPLAAEHQVPARAWAKILADSAIDGIVIAAPAAQHAALAGEALDAGKHVSVEKPMALDEPDAERLCRLAAERQRILMVGHLLQYHPAFLRLKELVGEGRLGCLQYIYSTRLNFGRIRREENILWSFAPHDISMILSLAGELPDRVSAIGANYLHRDIADVTTTHLAYRSGLNAHIFVSWLHPFKEQKLVVVGDHGMAVFDDGRPWADKLVLYPHRVEWRQGQPVPAKAEAQAVAEAEPLSVECRHFLDCIATGTTPRTDGQEGRRVLSILRAADQSIRLGRPVLLAAGASAPRAESGIHPTAIVDEPCQIGAGTKIWHFSHILAHSTIGKDCVIGQNVMIGPRVSIGDGCKVQNNVSVYQGVTLEEGVFCGPSMVFTNVLHPRAVIDRYATECALRDYLDTITYTDLMAYHQHVTTLIPDISGMARGLEFRSPFLNHHVVEFAASLPRRLTVPDRFSDRNNKAIVKKALAHHLPNDLAFAPKMGFGFGIDYAGLWRRSWRSAVLRFVENGDFRRLGFFSTTGIPWALENSTAAIWMLLTFSLWAEMYLFHRSPAEVGNKIRSALAA
ncbi:MAG: oxidoreductase [Alphaproteobacteria bacterium]|nr:oxidoreductase [Alphaproteobacteria bacterium]